jgi:hypothetical protein
MKQFIQLTSRILNKSHIVEIIKQNNKYFIYMSNKYIYGQIVLANGSLTTEQNIIEICEEKHKRDYTTITEELNKIN